VDPIPLEARADLGIGLNPLVRAASPLLLLAGQLRGAVSAMDVSDLRRQTLTEMRQFESDARRIGVPNDTVIAARYVLCAALDEAVLATPWGSQSEWAQHPLLVALHREAWGGEKFFEMLDRISPDPARHIDLMELQYLALALGFKGKYHLDPRGQEKLSSVQHDLYRKIRNHRGTPPAELSIAWRGLEDRRNPLIRYVPWWVVGAASLAVLAVTFTLYLMWLQQAADPLIVELEKIGFQEPPPLPPPAPRTLKQLLSKQEAAGLLTVNETVDEAKRVRTSTVILPAGNLFNSGRAELNPDYEQTIAQIAAELNKLEGPVEIVGHTDDQPPRSARYSNAQLSIARANNVKQALTRTINDPSRLSATGRGATEPAYPNSDEVNRARNRRVEIRHRSGV
jgi:type VI secretion system protein ImpK